jgi:hypothetical protein
VIRGRDRWDTWHGGGGEAGMCCVVLCCASGGGGGGRRHRNLTGREGGQWGKVVIPFLAGERRMLCSQMSRRRTLVRGIGVRPHFFFALALDSMVCYFGS